MPKNYCPPKYTAYIKKPYNQFADILGQHGNITTNLSTTLPPLSQGVGKSEIFIPSDISDQNHMTRKQIRLKYNKPGMGGMWQPIQGEEVDGHYILATGLSEFTPEESSQVIHALTIAYDTLTKTLQYKNNLPHPLMVIYFGHKYEEEKDRIFNAWYRVKDMVDIYMTQYPGYGKFRRVTNKEDNPEITQAHVDISKNDGLIFLHDAYFAHNMTPQMQAGILLHEISHLIRVSKINTIGPGTKDYFYLQDSHENVSTSKIVSDGELQQSYIANVEMLLHEVAAFKGVVVKESYYDQLIYEINSIKKSLTVEDAINIFNSSPYLRTLIATKNADSISFSAIQIANQINWMESEYINAEIEKRMWDELFNIESEKSRLEVSKYSVLDDFSMKGSELSPVSPTTSDNLLLSDIDYESLLQSPHLLSPETLTPQEEKTLDKDNNSGLIWLTKHIHEAGAWVDPSFELMPALISLSESFCKCDAFLVITNCDGDVILTFDSRTGKPIMDMAAVIRSGRRLAVIQNNGKQHYNAWVNFGANIDIVQTDNNSGMYKVDTSPQSQNWLMPIEMSGYCMTEAAITSLQSSLSTEVPLLSDINKSGWQLREEIKHLILAMSPAERHSFEGNASN
jgi:hypothetical protein